MNAEATLQRVRRDASQALASVRDEERVRLLLRFYRDLKRDNVTGVAGELAYRFFLASFPFLIFVVGFATVVANALNIQNPAGQIVSLVEDSVPSEAAEVMRSEVERVVGVGADLGVLSFSMIGAVWVASTAFATLMARVNTAFDIEETRSLVKRYIIAVGITMGAGLLIIVALTISLVGQLYGYRLASDLGMSGLARDAFPLLRYPIIIAMVWSAVVLIYWLSPSKRPPLAWLVHGATVFVGAWLVGSYVYGYYVSNVASYGVIYGTLGGVVVTMIWFYLTALALLVGAEINAFLLKEVAPDDESGDDNARASRRSGEQDERSQE